MRVKKNIEPLSHIARKNILKYIEKNKIKPYEQLPSESCLVKMLGVSRITVREALTRLEQQGIVYKIQGKGTFLQRVPIRMKNGLEILNSPTEIMESAGFTPHTIYLPTQISLPDKEIKEKLQLGPGERIITYHRKRYADGELAEYGVDSLSVRYFPKEIPEKLPRESMLNYLEVDLSIAIDHARTEIIPILLERDMAELLGISQNRIFLLLNQVHYDISGKPVVYSLDYFNPDVFNFIINRKRIRKR